MRMPALYRNWKRVVEGNIRNKFFFREIPAKNRPILKEIFKTRPYDDHVAQYVFRPKDSSATWNISYIDTINKWIVTVFVPDIPSYGLMQELAGEIDKHLSIFSKKVK